MSGRPAHPRGRQIIEDVRILRTRGHSMNEVAKRLGMSRATLYRIIAEAEARQTRR
jgi:predicted DNA-binding transcriptional regulator AlpA